MASVALLMFPNCVIQLQKQFSSFVSKKHKASLQRGWAGTSGSVSHSSDAAQGEPPQIAWQKQNWTSASGGTLGTEGTGGLSSQMMASREADLGTG